jgi:hypothetical protein
VTEQRIDLWAEHRDELNRLVERLTPEEALEVLRQIVKQGYEGGHVVPALVGAMRGMVERRGGSHDAK